MPRSPPLVNSMLKYVFFILLPPFFHPPPRFVLHSSELHFLFKPQTLMFFLLVPACLLPREASLLSSGASATSASWRPQSWPFVEWQLHTCSHSLGLKKANALAACFLHTWTVCVSMCAHIHQTQRTTCGSRLSPGLCGSWGLDSCCLAWWQAPLYAELNSVVLFCFLK